MKLRILFIMGVYIWGASSAYSLTICAKSSTYVGIVKKNPDGISSTYDNDNKYWKVDFDYKTVTGLAACNEISGTVATATTNLYTSSVDVGQHCWCKMEPVKAYGYETGLTSYWIYLTAYADASTCGNSCTSACADAVKSNLSFRTGMYESIW